MSCNSGQKRSVQLARVTSSTPSFNFQAAAFKTAVIEVGQEKSPSSLFERTEYRGFIAVVAELILLRVSLPQQNLEYLET